MNPPHPQAPSTAQAFARFHEILSAAGARAALAYVLGLSDYRCIGVFRFKDGKADAAIHYDRENPEVLQASEVPETATYCCFVRDSKGVFMTVDALLDPRLQEHPARHAVAAYCGVPILSPEGEFIGSLCHYDMVPRDPSRLDLELLLQVASALEQGRHVPAYPSH